MANGFTYSPSDAYSTPEPEPCLECGLDTLEMQPDEFTRDLRGRPICHECEPALTDPVFRCDYCGDVLVKPYNPKPICTRCYVGG